MRILLWERGKRSRIEGEQLVPMLVLVETREGWRLGVGYMMPLLTTTRTRGALSYCWI